MLGGALMREVGLHYLVGTLPEHSILLLVTNNGQVEWRDMLYASDNEILNDEIIKGKRADGKPLTVSDLVAFSRKPQPRGIMFEIDRSDYLNKLPGDIRQSERQYLIVNAPEFGEQLQVLKHFIGDLHDINQHEAAVEAYRLAISRYPTDFGLHNDFGALFFDLELYAEAINEYEKAIRIDPKNYFSYYLLGNSLFKLNRFEEAIEAYKEVVELNANFVYSYANLGLAYSKLGLKYEAIRSYKQYLKLAKKKPG